MAVSAKDVKTLREMSGAGMMDCKKALVASDSDMDKAVDWLRENGLSKAAKKEGRVSAEGLISMSISDDYKSATINEINSETDFVAKNDTFITLTQNTVDHIHSNSFTTVEELMSSTIDNMPFDESFKTQAAVIGENLVQRRFGKLSVESDGIVNGYIHSNGRIGVIVAAKCDSEKTAQEAKELVKHIAMHAAAMKPTVLNYTDLDSEFVEKETIAIRADIEKENEELIRLGKPLKKIPLFVSKSQHTKEALASVKNDLEAELKAQGKPEKIWDKIIPGQMDRFIADNTQLDQQFALLDQFFIMDDKKSVAQAVEDRAKQIGGTIEIVDFIRYEVGEGIEKKEDNFADEVAAALK